MIFATESEDFENDGLMFSGKEQFGVLCMSVEVAGDTENHYYFISIYKYLKYLLVSNSLYDETQPCNVFTFI